MDCRLTDRIVGFGRREAGLSSSYSIIRLIVDNFRGVLLNVTDSYHLFMLSSTTNTQEKGK